MSYHIISYSFARPQAASKPPPPPPKLLRMAPPAKSPASCGDVPPSSTYTCKQQASWGQVRRQNVLPWFCHLWQRVAKQHPHMQAAGELGPGTAAKCFAMVFARWQLGPHAGAKCLDMVLPAASWAQVPSALHWVYPKKWRASPTVSFAALCAFPLLWIVRSSRKSISSQHTMTKIGATGPEPRLSMIHIAIRTCSAD
jgi:hypothetical protein